MVSRAAARALALPAVSRALSRPALLARAVARGAVAKALPLVSQRRPGSGPTLWVELAMGLDPVK